MNILFLGAPGSGKSTQGQILAEKRGMKWLSSGQMFRESKDPEILKILETSQLVSDEITNRMMAKAIRENLDFGVILDGYPRTLNQVEYIFNEGIKIDMVVEIDVPVEELLKLTESKGETPFFLICDSVNDPHNLGALIRSANCAGVNGVIIPKRRAVGVNGTVAKSSAGAVFSMPVARVPNLLAAVRYLKENGVWIWAVEAGGKPYYDQDYKGKCALILGSEGEGVSSILKKESDFIAGIPMYGSVNSLNVSAAGAIVMFEAARQRNSGKAGEA